MTAKIHDSSFRDNSGFIFIKDNIVYRRINLCYKESFNKLMESGLYQKLADEGLIVKHTIVDVNDYWSEESYLTIKPEQIPFISYPYEWCFSQLQDAAKATIRIAQIALECGMILRDASAYNIQFVNGKALLIDTLSFGIKDNKPWVAYGQFCRHFLAPLLIAKYKGYETIKYLASEIDGFPLDLASGMLPKKTRFNFSIYLHIHLHAQSVKKYSNKQDIGKNRHASLSDNSLKALFSSLYGMVHKIRIKKVETEWASYYNDFSYNDESFKFKKDKVKEYILKSRDLSQYIVDLGANDGEFSRIGISEGFEVIAADIDHGACEHNYRKINKNKEAGLLPMLINLANPSPAIGFSNKERDSFAQRINDKKPILMALALIHHLSISNNTPLDKTASFFASLCKAIIIEFVPKSDPQTQKLLVSREDIFDKYTKENFEKVYSEYFNISESVIIPGTERTLYLMTPKEA